MISSFVYKQFDLSRVYRKTVSSPGTFDHRVFLRRRAVDQPISPWHHIPLFMSGQRDIILPFVCEIPRTCTAKMEVKLSEEFNPISHDIKNGKLRYMPIEPKFNYGMLPMTYEDPRSSCPISKVLGDGDPIDVVDISTRNSTGVVCGSVVPVKLLGSFCFIDNGEADWKIIVSRNDSEEINPSVMNEVFGFFENYKPGSGSYIFDDKRVFDVAETIEIIKHTQRSYENLINNGGIMSEGNLQNNWIP